MPAPARRLDAGRVGQAVGCRERPRAERRSPSGSDENAKVPDARPPNTNSRGGLPRPGPLDEHGDVDRRGPPARATPGGRERVRHRACRARRQGPAAPPASRRRSTARGASGRRGPCARRAPAPPPRRGRRRSAGPRDGPSSGIAEPVADAAHGPDHRAGVAQLVAQVVDVGVDGVGRDRHAERPGMVEQLVAA